MLEGVHVSCQNRGPFVVSGGKDRSNSFARESGKREPIKFIILHFNNNHAGDGGVYQSKLSLVMGSHQASVT